MMKISTLTLFFILILAASGTFSGCESVAGGKYLKLGHALEPSHSVHQAMVYMAERVNEKSGGKLKIKVYPSQQLGSERELLELLQIGSLAMTKVSSGVLENFAPGMKVFGMPYLFDSREQIFKVLDGEIGQELLDEGQKYWLRGLAYYDAGSRSFYTVDKPVDEPEDLTGLKVRVLPSITSMQMVRAMGGSPTPISWGELYTALQQGIVDGAENNPPSFYLSNHFEVCKYYSLDEHTALPDVLIISTIVWDSLTDQEKEWLKEAVQESVVYQRELWKKAEKEALDAVRAAGVEISYPDKKPFVDEVASMYEEYMKDEQMKSLIQRIRAVK